MSILLIEEKIYSLNVNFTLFHYTGESLSNSTTIEELGVEPGQSISLVVQLSPGPPTSGVAPTNQQQLAEAPPSLAVTDGYHMPDAFTVQVPPTGEGGSAREVLVKVCNEHRV